MNIGKIITAIIAVILIGGAFMLWEYRDSPLLAPFLGAMPSPQQQSTSTTPVQEGWQSYASSTLGISFNYPPGYTLDTNYSYQEMGPGNDIPGVKVTIPQSMATGTNLNSGDTGVSVEELSQTSPPAGGCSANLFLDNAPAAKNITDNGVNYSLASTTGAAAGNRYEEVVYALAGRIPCTAVRYLIHYGVLENYPPGMVQQFNEAALLQDFDGIRHSLVTGL